MDDLSPPPSALPSADLSVPAPEPYEAPISLHDFCVRHSLVERGVELLGAFHALENLVAAPTRPHADWLARLAAFAARPVG